MPFTLQARRGPMVRGEIKEPERGDFCFMEYRPMIRAWLASPRWTTADAIYQQYLLRRAALMHSIRKLAPLDLAWQVFFSLHVLPYEVKKRKENGEVTE